MHSLLEIREAHPDTPWRLDQERKLGFRKDTAEIIKDLGSKIIRKSVHLPAPHYVDRLRFASLIARHIA